MNAEGLQIEAVDWERLDELLTLVRDSLGPGSVPRSETFFRWKHVENPFGRSAGLVALAGEQIVALRLMLRWRFVSREREYRAVRAVDTATHRDWRGQGLFRRLTLALIDALTEESVDFVFNTPNAQSRPGYLSMGWHDAGRVPVLLRPRYWRGEESAGVRVGTVEEWAASGALKSFSDQALPQQPETPRSAEYLRWRFAERSRLGYRVAWSERGFVAGRLRRRGRLREFDVAELRIDPSDRRVAAKAADLLRAVSAGAHYLTASAPGGSEARRMYSALGFRPVPWVGPRLTLRPLAEPVIPSLAFALGDLEVF